MMSRNIIPYTPPEGLTSVQAIKDGRILHEGEVYYGTPYYAEKYTLDNKWIYDAKENGLPHILFGHAAYIKEEDFHAYCAGKIGGMEHGYYRSRGNRGQ